MTPRERAKALRKELLTEHAHQGFKDDFDRKIEAAITEHVRALLSEKVKREIGETLPDCYRHWGCMNAFVTSLRRKALGE